MSSRSRRITLLFAVLASLLAGCARAEHTVELNGQEFVVELALTRDEQAMGLMFRESMPDNAGMLFVFPSEAVRSFWMKNTRIPLDILYFDDDLRLVSMAERARPCTVQRCPSYPSEGQARYVLELNAGKARELGLKPGDELILNFDL